MAVGAEPLQNDPPVRRYGPRVLSNLSSLRDEDIIDKLRR